MDTQLETLREQLMQAAEAFSTDASAMSELMESMVLDVERAESEPLEIVPVAHHSPACGLHMLRRLHSRRPKVIFMELCEDMRELLPKLGECGLPVALQAFASESHEFPTDWAPLTVVAPITEFSAEYQAMSYALTYGVELVLVDRSVDHVFQQIPQEQGALDERLPTEEEREASEERDEHVSHGSALGIQLGNVVPTFDAFTEFLLRNAHVHHFSEWWEQYVENTVIHADWETYRRVMCLVGSLLRRLGRREEDVESDRWRERYMWTRMKQYMKEHDIAPEDAMYICGAIHAVSDVEEYGTHTDKIWEIPPRTKTEWLYGLIPSSFSAIERQFSHPPGTVSLAESTWKKGLASGKLKSFHIPRDAGAVAKSLPKPKVIDGRLERSLSDFLVAPPEGAEADEAQLLNWCVQVVKLARKNNYLATTADSIAIYQTSMLLAGMRNRLHPSAYDFRDAAVTCLEKNGVPGKRDIPWICDILLGGDRYGRVGYDSLPPLAKNVYDRLKVLPITLLSSTVQRALMDFGAHPEYLPASDLLWKIHYLTGNSVARPIMGERTLGHVPLQESWDISIGKNQRPVIELGYEGVTIEQVLDLRLKKKAFASKATTLTALEATEDSILYLKSRRLTEELGQRAVQLLYEEASAQDAPGIFDRIRSLVHYYRAQPEGLADWIKDFVSTGYSHYATLLPEAFGDRDTSPSDIAAMMGFIFTLESLALSLGCDRSQLLIAIRQANDVQITPDKIGLLWSAQFLLGERSAEEIRAFFDESLDNELMVPALPHYIMGFVLALRFTPLVGRLVVELMSKSFARLPDRILLPWLPNLIMTLKPLSHELMPLLIKEASSSFPRHLPELDEWEFPWERPIQTFSFDAGESTSQDASAGVELSEEESAARSMLFGFDATGRAVDVALGLEGPWTEEVAAPTSSSSAGPSLSGEELAARQMLAAHSATAGAIVGLLGGDEGSWELIAQKPSSAGTGAEKGAARSPARAMLDAHGETMEALEELL